MIFFHFIYILSLVVWIGSIVFFSFFTAPVVFKILDREQAGEVVGAIFCGYYRIGYVCGILAIASLIGSLPTLSDGRLVILPLMVLCTFFAGMVVGPKARNLKERIKSEGGPGNVPGLKAQFDKLHSASVRLNGIVLILGLTVLWLTAGSLNF